MKKLHQPQNLANAAHIPNWLIQIPCKMLSFGAKLTYARLCKWAGKDGKAFRSASQLAIELGSSERQIQRYTQELKEAELIGTFQPQAGGINHFEFYDHVWMYRNICDELLYKSYDDPTTDCRTPPTTDCRTPPTTHVTYPYDTCDVPPTTHVADIIDNKGVINTTTTNSGQKLTKDRDSEPVVVTSLLQEKTPDSNQDSITEHHSDISIQTCTENLYDIFISQYFDKILLEAYRKRPVKTANIKDELDYLSACKYEVDHRPEGISIPARVKQRIKFTLEGTFEEPVEWGRDIIRKRNALIAEDNLRKHEAATQKRRDETMKELPIKPGIEGFKEKMKELQEEEKKSHHIKIEERKHIYRPYKSPEECQLQ
jgi:Helix-turn-helix domain